MLDDDEAQPSREDQFELALADVAVGRGSSSAYLEGLSLLSPEQSERFRAVWDRLTVPGKTELLTELSVLEQDTLRADFSEIYHIGILDSNDLVRQNAIQAIVADDSYWLLEQLIKLADDDEAPGVRQVATAALGPFAARAELGELRNGDPDRILGLLLDILHRTDEALDTRGAALTSMGYFSVARVQDEIQARYDDDYFRPFALRAMGNSADPRWLETVLQDLADDDDEIRQLAAEAAGGIAEASAVEALGDLLEDVVSEVRSAAVFALGAIGGPEARELLEYAVEDDDEAVRDAALEMLEDLDFYDDPLAR